MATAFHDVKPFPGKPLPAAGGVGHNKPPLEEMILADFMEDLRSEDGLLARIEELSTKGSAAGKCDSQERAGRYGDFVKAAGVCAKAVEQIRERHNRPILTAQRALKGRADSIVAPLADAVNNVRRQLDAFMAEQRRIAAEQQRLAEEQARKAREAAEAERQRQLDEARANGELDEAEVEIVPTVVEVRQPEIEKPAVRGDYGARVGSQTVWKHEILSVRQLPDALLKHPKVVEALDKLIAQQVRSGTREIKGVRIWDEQQTVVR